MFSFFLSRIELATSIDFLLEDRLLLQPKRCPVLRSFSPLCIFYCFENRPRYRTENSRCVYFHTRLARAKSRTRRVMLIRRIVFSPAQRGKFANLWNIIAVRARQSAFATPTHGFLSAFFVVYRLQSIMPYACANRYRSIVTVTWRYSGIMHSYCVWVARYQRSRQSRLEQRRRSLPSPAHLSLRPHTYL